MAAFLAQFQSIKGSSERLVVAIEDVNDLWPVVKEGFEARVPFRKACLNSKARNPVLLDKLPVEYILTTDSRLRSRLPQEQSPFWFRHPYAIIVLVTCEDLDEYKTLLKPRLKLIVQNEDREWFIVFVSKAQLANDPAGKLIKRIYNKLEVDFSSKRRERCCKLEMHVADAAFWEDVESKIVECIRYTLDRRVQLYEEEIRILTENRFTQSWNFCTFFILKESLAFMFELSQLQEDALREYDELEQCYLELVNGSTMKQKEFGGQDPGDDSAALLDVHRKPLSGIVEEDTLREFDFRQYLFARQAQLLFFMNRPLEVAARGFSFIISFSKVLSEHEKTLPFCLREVWVITACMILVHETTERLNPRSLVPEVEKEFYRLVADLYSLARVKLMRLADLTGYGKSIERSPCNSAALSMLPWPKPWVWPSVPADAASRISAKEQVSIEKIKPFGISRNPLPLAPSSLLREANRRRASLSVGNISELLDSRLSFKSPAGDSGTPSASPPPSVPAFPSRSVSFGPSSPDNPLASPPPSVPTIPSRSVSFGPSSPDNKGSKSVCIDRPMQLAEIHAAAEFAIQKLMTSEKLRSGLSSIQGFEEMYAELTAAAADNYHKSWRKRHGVVLDGEVASLHFRHGNYDSAAKLYEKVCALYSGDRWHALLAAVLPNLAECQKQLGDLAGYLLSCIKLLSLERGLLLDEERHTIQSEVLRMAHSALKNPVSLDVSALITFSGRGGSPLKLCEGDPGNLSISVWSGFPGEITLDFISVTLIATFTADEGVKVVRSAEAPSLKPGKNNVLMVLPPQRAGSYVLGVLTGQIGQVRLRSHTYCTTSALSSKGGSPESDDFLSLERPLKPVLQVSEPRPLVEITCAVSWGLLMNEAQWLGLIVRPIDYSLKGAVLTLMAGPHLVLDDPQDCELEVLGKLFKGVTPKQCRDTSIDTSVPAAVTKTHKVVENGYSRKGMQEKELLSMNDGKVVLPDWTNNQSSVLWFRVRAIQDRMEIEALKDGQHAPSQSLSPEVSPGSNSMNGTVMEDPISHDLLSADLSKSKDIKKQGSFWPKNSPSVGVRRLDLKLDFGPSHSRIYERTVTVQFLEPLRTVSRIVARGNDNNILLQVTLISQLNATITIMDAWLDLQPGFVHSGVANGRPYPPSILPLVMAPSSESALLFTACSMTSNKENGTTASQGQPNIGSTLRIHYKILGDRTVGAHSPYKCVSKASKENCQEETTLLFKSVLFLQMPILEPLLAVGMLSLSSNTPCVGEQLLIQWRVERLKEGLAKTSHMIAEKGGLDMEELYYEVEVDQDNWMLAGRRKGYLSLPLHVSARVMISMACVPLIAGYVRPPTLGLPFIDKTRISCTPPGPHLMCVLPPALCSSFYIKR